MRSSRIVRLLFLLPCALVAQPDRIAAPIDAGRTVVLKGNIHPMVQARFDQGPVEPAFRIGYITLMLKKTEAQQAGLEQLLLEQQDPASPNYHDWLTPEQYADRFGLSQNDLDKISAWLESEGFSVEYTARGRNWLAFSGTAGQVQAAFHTEVRRYRVDGEPHFAAAAEPTVPASLEPVVAGFLGLDDFYPRAPKRPLPAFTDGTGRHSLVPDDVATIYNLGPLYQAGFDGTGQKIVVVGQSAINIADITGFRTKYNLPSLSLQTIPYPADPGTSGSLAEADIDLEWAGAVAPKAALIYVYGRSADGAAFYAIDNILAPVITESFGVCEAERADFLSWYRTEAQKAIALGITWLASTGDTGAAGCDYNADIAVQGLGVNFPASIPEVTAVGGTEFDEGSGGYWNTNNGPNGGSAVSYIPEKAWNDTAAGIAGGVGLLTSGGGVSSSYPKPAWQTGAGVPNDGFRDLPDLSLNASNVHDPYNVMTGGAWKLFGGTSVSTPVFAGMVALLNQYLVANKVQSKPGMGNINPTLYRLAQSAPSAFHDITTGDNFVPCAQRTPDCTTGQLGYSAGPGYDLVTGLGSVDAYNLVTQWNGTPGVGTTTTVTASSTSITSSGSTSLTVTVRAASGNISPMGSVTFTVGGTTLGTANLSGSGGAATASLSVSGSRLAAGSNTITATYAGSNGFGDSSGSVTVSLTVPGVSTTTTVTANPYSITPSGSTALTATVRAASGSSTPAGSVSFALGSTTLGAASLHGSGSTATASLSISGSRLAAGNNIIIASYGGMSGFGASSASVTVNVAFPTTTSIGGVAHGASYLHVYAPGMVLSVFGANLAPFTQLADGLPLPPTMAGVSATVNGIAAPLYFVSQLQLNIQIPYETATGTALLAVSNNGQVATYYFPVSASAPGLFTLEQSGSGPITPNSGGSRGQIYTLFVTGAGAVSPPVATGAGPTGTQVPVPLLAVSVTIGGVAAHLEYAGIPVWSVGTLQINFTVPQNAPLGVQPVVVKIGSATSAAAATFTVSR